MAAKYQLITELYQRTGAAVSRNPQAWQSFLSSACRNYKCRFDEQLLIFAQRPDATAVTTLETWNRQFKRWVNKDSRGIAVFDTKGRRNTLKYYFDVSDTHEGYYNSRPVPIWQMNERYEQAVIERLSDRFGNLESGDLGEALMQTAKNAVEDNLPDYLAQLKECTKDSFLEELDDFNVEVIYKRLAVNSVAFMLMSRCGLDTGEYFEIEDFSDIINFNTPATINAIGLAASDISEMALREISQTVRNVQISERSQNRTFAQPAPKQYDVGRKQPERSNDNERNHLHETGGLPYSRPNITDRARTSAWQIRYDAQELSGAEQASDLSQSADIGETLRTSLPDRTDRTPEIGASDEAALRGTGRDGGAERESTDAVGRNDEQYSQSSGGGHFDRTDLQVSIANEDEVRANLPTVDEQIEMMVEAEEEKSSAFSVSQEDIDSVLVNVGGIAQTEAQKSSDLFMKCRYLDEITGNRGTIFATGTPVSNSMVELYSVQRYLQYDTLMQNGLQHFDSWASTFGETVTALELAPEGTNYRAKTRFAKFYNLPELMQMFREVADIQTSDMLKLPVPKVNYHNIKTKPSEIQTEMVANLAKRAEKVRARLVEPNIDNMLKITNDGRKLALDQRMIDPMLPDDPDSKVNACVDNVYRIWEEHADTKATQLVFCDLSTPKGDGSFNIYDDIRGKLTERGIPAEQVRFIHEATTDAQKKELFAKVRSGEVRVLLGSTPKMGAGTNVQDRLIAIHNLDCPWRPSDLEQRQGRIERQGNLFPEVEVYRYVTEQTFDAYLYQLVESKQKFISQIMTSKSPVRSAEDVDEVALSFAEVKMLATGDERFKEKMDLDIQVSKLRVLKQSYLSEHYDLEDRILQQFPKLIKEYEERIAGYEADTVLAEQHKSQGEDKFCPMTLQGVTYTEKADAGQMLLALCKENPLSKPTEIGSYRGFKLEVYYDPVNSNYCLNLCGKSRHKVELGSDALGNLTRIENELSRLPAMLTAAKTRKEESVTQLENAKVEVKKPFAFEEELKEKTDRLNALNIELNLDEKDPSAIDTEPEQGDEPPERKNKDLER